jgi:nucleotide-binding universal stress UspA family protein
MHILLCADDTPRSEPALAFGSRLAGLLRAQVTLLGAPVRPDGGDLPRIAADTCEGLRAAGVRCEILTRPEEPRRAITAQATQIPYDLIAVGLLERGRIRRCLRGPSTRRILRDVSAPVLVVPSDRPELRRILVCTGDLWYPTAAIHLVGRLAQAAGAAVTLLYVAPEPLLRYPILREVEDAWGALLQTDTPQGQNLKAGRDALRDLGVETGVLLRHGRVDRQILAEILEGEYDLVALGSTYAARGLHRYFVGSITDLAVERAERPVLVVRNQERPSP